MKLLLPRKVYPLRGNTAAQEQPAPPQAPFSSSPPLTLEQIGRLISSSKERDTLEATLGSLRKPGPAMFKTDERSMSKISLPELHKLFDLAKFSARFPEQLPESEYDFDRSSAKEAITLVKGVYQHLIPIIGVLPPTQVIAAITSDSL
jgi:hypothetical protein